MKTKEELNELKKEVEKLTEKLKPLSEEELAQVTGGMKMVSGGVNESGILDNILQELTNWLDKHPNATKLDIYQILIEKKDEYPNELTEEEMNLLNQLLNSFAS